MDDLLEMIASVKRIQANPALGIGSHHLAHMLLEEAAEEFRLRVIARAAWQQLSEEFLRGM